MPSTSTDRLVGTTTSVALKPPCRLKTTTNHSLSGLAPIDGVTPAERDRILVGSQTSAIGNGIYNASVNAWTRATDFDGSLDAVGGTQVHVTSGTANGNTYWKISGDPSSVTVGTDTITFVAGGQTNAAAVSFTPSGASAVTRTTQNKLREAPFSPEDYGAAGDNSTDDTTAIAAAFTAAAAAGGGVVQLTPGLTYKTTAETVVLGGVRFNMNESKIRAILTGGGSAGVSMRDNSIIENGHVEVDSLGSPGTQTGAHAAIRLGSIDGSAGTVASPTIGDSPTGCIIRNMIVESDKWINVGGGEFRGAAGIQINGGVNNLTIENITIPDNAFMAIGIAADWGYLGTLSSTATFANMTTNRTNFDAGTAYTTHPNNITIRNIKIGALTAAASVIATVDIGSFGIRLSSCYNVTVDNVTTLSATYIVYRHTAGDLGFEFAPAVLKHLACKNVVFNNCTVQTQTAAVLFYSDSFADNVDGAARTSAFTASISGSTMTVSASASGSIAVGHTVYSARVPVGVVSAFGTGVGGTGTYTLTGAVATSSTSMNSGYGWLIDPLHTTNIVASRITGKGLGTADASYGLRVIQQRGGSLIDCDASYYLNGINVDEQVFGLSIQRPHCHSNRADGIYIHHPTYPPEGVTVQDVYCHDNGTDSGYADPVGVHLGTSLRPKLIRGRYGNATGTETTQEFGYRIGAGCVGALVEYPEVLAYEAGGGESFVQATDATILTRSGIGYVTGGGTVTQGTSKATAVTLNKKTGAITTFNDALNAGVIVSFTVNNSLVVATDAFAIGHESGGTIGAYTVNMRATGAGAAEITLRNNTAGNLSEALELRYALIKSVDT